jgi:hypothetical protein
VEEPLPTIQQPWGAIEAPVHGEAGGGDDTRDAGCTGQDHRMGGTRPSLEGDAEEELTRDLRGDARRKVLSDQDHRRLWQA